MITKNFHTHTFRCKHAEGEVDDYCQAALDSGLDTLGFSDHTPYPTELECSRHDWAMAEDELPGYFKAIEEAKEKFPSLKIYSGLECEYRKDLDAFYRRLIADGDVEYLVLGQHYVPMGDQWYFMSQLADESSQLCPDRLFKWLDLTLEALHTGMFAFMAHPDLFMSSAIPWNRGFEDCSKQLLKAVESLKIPVEINCLGLRKPLCNDGTEERRRYPYRQFWKLARDYDVQVLINSDAHYLKDVRGNLDEAFDFLGPDHHLNIINNTYVPQTRI